MHKAEARSQWAAAHSDVFRAAEHLRIREINKMYQPSVVQGALGKEGITREGGGAAPREVQRSYKMDASQSLQLQGDVSGIVGTLAFGVRPKMPDAPHSNPKFHPLPPLRPPPLRSDNMSFTRSSSLPGTQSKISSSCGFRTITDLPGTPSRGSQAELTRYTPSPVLRLSESRGSTTSLYTSQRQEPPLRQSSLESGRITGRESERGTPLGRAQADGRMMI